MTVRVEILEGGLEFRFYRAGGPGAQHNEIVQAAGARR